MCMGIMLQLDAMEQKRFEETNNKENKPKIFIAEHIQKKIDRITQELREDLEYLGDDEYLVCIGEYMIVVSRQLRQAEYFNELADIVLNAGTAMSRTAKLEHLIGDTWYEARKKIVTEMIEIEKINPDEITVNGVSPLTEVVLFKDISFFAFLLEQGAKFQLSLKPTIEDVD